MARGGRAACPPPGAGLAVRVGACTARRSALHLSAADSSSESGPMYALFQLIDTIITIYIWIIILQVILSWLVAFKVVNTGNRVIYVIGDALYRLTEPVMRPVRKIIPSIGGFDISPVVVILLLVFIRNLIIVDLAHSVR
jgi:YggT family protein